MINQWQYYYCSQIQQWICWMNDACSQHYTCFYYFMLFTFEGMGHKNSYWSFYILADFIRITDFLYDWVLQVVFEIKGINGNIGGKDFKNQFHKPEINSTERRNQEPTQAH